MTEPTRLRESAGPARQLMRGSGLAVPGASRRRALAFTAAAANLAASGTALAAGGMSLAKSVALCVSLGVVSGGLASLGVSSAITSWDEPRESAPVSAAPARPASARRSTLSVASSPEGVPALPESAPSAAEPEPAATVTREPAPSRGAPSVVGSSAPGRRSLFDEQREIEGARAAIARGDFTRGLKLLDAYERSFPRGQFHPEALALRVEALSSRGDAARAKVLADDFARRYPQHPLLTRVQASVGRK